MLVNHAQGSNGPTVSIVTTAYNAESTIERAVRSVFAQTCPSWQLVVIDDGSADATSEILRSLKEELDDDRLVVILGRPNQGPAGARNEALRHATGEWIAFLDSDDEVTPDRVQRLLDEAEDDRPGPDGARMDVVVCRHLIILGEGEAVARGRDDGSEMTGEEACLQLLTEGITPYLWDKAYRASTVAGIEMPAVRRAEDKVYNVEALRRAGRVRIIPDALVRYHVSPTSLTWGRVSPDEETRVLNRATWEAAGDLAQTVRGERALRTSVVLAYVAVVHQRIFNRQSPVRPDASLCSWRDICAALVMRPVIGIAGGAIKIVPRVYSWAYRRFILSGYGLGAQ